MLVFWLSFLLSDLMPIATVLMHGLVWGRAMDLMLWKRKKKKRCEKRELQREWREKEKFKEEEDKNCESSQVTTWHVFIGWRKISVLR